MPICTSDTLNTFYSRGLYFRVNSRDQWHPKKSPRQYFSCKYYIVQEMKNRENKVSWINPKSWARENKITRKISVLQYATVAACQQRTLTPPDTWSCPTLGLACVLMSRSISPELLLSPDFGTSLLLSSHLRYFFSIEVRWKQSKLRFGFSSSVGSIHCVQFCLKLKLLGECFVCP